MKIKVKLGIATVGLSFIILTMFLVTWAMTGKQKDDGLVINLAGRQRMLSQRMTKEILYFQMQREQKPLFYMVTEYPTHLKLTCSSSPLRGK